MNSIQLTQELENKGFVFDLRAILSPACSAFRKPQVSATMLNRLNYLSRLTGGAVGVVSDMEIMKMKSILKSVSDKLLLVGSHGGEFEDTNNDYSCVVPSESLDSAREEIIKHMSGQKPAYVENKKLSIAIHFGAAPELRGSLYQMLSGVASKLGPRFQVVEGHYCWELKEGKHNNGMSLVTLANRANFLNKTLYFFGSGYLAESTFLTTNLLGGKSVHIGDVNGSTRAQLKLSGVHELEDWLRRVCILRAVPELPKTNINYSSMAA